MSIFMDNTKIVYYMETHFQFNTDFDYNGNTFHIGRGETMNLNISPDENFYHDDLSNLKFEHDFTNLINTIYPAWSVEEHFINHMKQQGEPYLYFKPAETFDGQPHIFRFEIMTDQVGNEWYRYLSVE